MHSIIESHRDEIANLCRRHQVRRLDLFGSSVSGDFDAQRSDLDFIVEFANTAPEGAADRYFDLREALQAMLGRPVDLVIRRAVRNPYFLQAATQEQRNLYAA